MTDTFSSTTAHPLPQPSPVTATALQPVVNGSPSEPHAPEDEEYTIKCICTYADDDGSTVFCEKCETWQHIVCYYPDNDVPEFHYCVDCQPRSLDGQSATEQQRRLRAEQADSGDRKQKRPPSKSHKKKVKPQNATGDQINGWHGHERHDSASASRDQPPPAKRPKTSHRTSGSMHSTNGTPNLSDSRKRAFSNGQSYPSPIKSPQDNAYYPNIPKYSMDFLELYERDEGKHNVTWDTENSHTITAIQKLRAWQQHPHTLTEETGRTNIEEPFIQSDVPLDRSTWPVLTLEQKVNTEFELNGRHPSWHLLRLQADVRKGDLVGEVRGRVGSLAEYCQDPSNRWQELRHPEPFVFFHPSMPIYIDSRREGTIFRYLRRSCHPNVTLKTFATSDNQWHYCFVASDDLQAGVELTAQWYMEPSNENDPQSENERVSRWCSRLLANFGDCACGSNNQCRMAPFDRRRPSQALEIHSKSNSKKRKAKARHAISPMSTGQATNSRAGSENIKIHEEDDYPDSRSVSSSSRSKSQGRDITPSNVGQLDADPVLGAGLTARERRKIAMAEAAFEKVEQTQQHKKKKRTSGGSTLNTPHAGTSHQLAHSMPNTPNLFGRATYNDTGTSSRFSGSPPPLKPSTTRNTSNQSPSKSSAPNTPALLSPYPRPDYVHSAMQTDPDENERAITPLAKRRRYTTPNQRLLKKVLDERVKFEQDDGAAIDESRFASPQNLANPKIALKGEDVEMEDASAAELSPFQLQSVLSYTSQSPAIAKNTASTQMNPPLPSQAAHSITSLHAPNGKRLQLNTLPPVPSFATSATSPSPLSSTPGAISMPVPQSPAGSSAGSVSYPGLSNGIITPSPVKKKLSLGDYMSRRSTLATTPSLEKTQLQSFDVPNSALSGAESPMSVTSISKDTKSTPSVMLKPSDSLKQTANSTACVEEAIVDTPMKDELAIDSLAHAVLTPPTTSSFPIPHTTTTNVPTAPPAPFGLPSGTIPPNVANVLSILNAMNGNQRSPSASSS